MKTILIALLCVSCSPKIVSITPADSLKVATEKKEIRSETKHLMRNYMVAIVVFGFGIHYMGWDMQKQ